MKSLIRTAVLFMLVWALSPVATTSALGSPSAVKQSIRITSISAHCLEESDDEIVVYIVEGAKVCKINVRVQGRKSTKSKVTLETYDSESGWKKSDWKVQTTKTSGNATFTLTVAFPNKPGDECYYGETFSYRFAISKIGKFKAFRSGTFDIAYTSADDNPACTESDYEEDYEDDYEYEYE